MGEQKPLYPQFDNQLWLRSCDHEIIQPVEAQVTGEMPPWLSGSLMRNGPGATHIGESVHYEHIFDGPGLLHRYSIMGGAGSRVTYQCRFVRSRMLEQTRVAQRVIFTEFGTRAVPDPCHSIFKRMSLAFNSEMSTTDNTCINIYPMGDQLYAFTETSFINRIDPESLDTCERVDLKQKIALVHHSAHPHTTSNGDVYNAGLTVVNGVLKHVIVKFPAKSEGDMFESASVVAEMRPRWPLHPSYMHSFGVTDKFWVIVEQPLAISIPRVLWSQFYSGDPVTACLKWYPDEDTHIVLLCRQSGREMARYSTRAFFFMHVVNAFQCERSITLELCTFRDAHAINALYVHSVQNAQSNADFADWFRSRPVRFNLPLPMGRGGASGDAGTTTPIRVEPELIVDVGMEMPRINDNFNGKHYKYFYSLSTDVDDPKQGSLVKVDRETGKCLFWHERDCFPSEPIFVARPGATEEDDGVIVSALSWGQRARGAALLVLDAQTWSERARASLTVPGPHVRSLHGCFRPNTTAQPKIPIDSTKN